jgi:hypothetical protein
MKPSVLKRLEALEAKLGQDPGVPTLCQAIEIARSGDREAAATLKEELEQKLEGDPKSWKVFKLAHAMLVSFLGRHEP